MLSKYGLRARLAPSLLCLFPLFVMVAVWVPDLYAYGTGLVGLATACGITTLLAHFARSAGLKVQLKLIAEKWGAMPSTICLRHSDSTIDAISKRRYHAFLESKVNGWSAPSEELEASNARDADTSYDAAVRWLLEYTRDTSQFPLLFEENISYGFRRNSLGLRPLGLAIAVLTLTAGVYLTYQLPGPYLSDANIPHIASQMVSVILLLWWLVVVTKDWVSEAAFKYATTLLAACDS